MSDIQKELSRYGQEFDTYQLEEIQLGLEAGLDVAVYARKEFFPVQMEQIRLGMLEKLPVEIYARTEYDWFQMEEIRKGLSAGLDVSSYAKPELPFETMRQLRKGLEEGLDLSAFVQLNTGVLRQFRKARLANVDITGFINEGYDAEQLEQIRLAMESGVDIKPYLIKEFRGASIKEIRLGLESGIDVSQYDKIELNWQQMREIRLGLEHQIDVSCYNHVLYAWQQMEEIRLGLEAGLDVSEYKSMMYTASDMRQKRLEMLAAFEQELSRKKEEEAVTYLQLENIKITVSADEMQAFLLLKYQENYTYQVGYVIDILKQRGICCGIIEENIRNLVENKNWDVSTLVARGTEPTMGRDGYYEYFFRTDLPKESPVQPDGSVDYTKTEWFEMVEAGQKLAVYHPAEAGTVGCTVTGRKLPARKGREQSALSGKGFTLMPDKKTYVSRVTGKIDLAGKWMFVSRVFVVNEVTPATGNIKFDGGVYVKGDVGKGVVIDATGDIVVEGNVEGAVIRSGRRVLLKKGMTGAGVGSVEAKQDVVGQFFEEVSIRTEGNIQADYCMNCQLWAEGRIIMKGKNGLLAGGNIYAAKGIETYHLGSRAARQTLVRVGMDEMTYQQQEALEQQMERSKKEMKIFQTAYMDFRLKYPPELRCTMETFLKIEAAIYTKEVEMEEIRKSQEEFKEREKELAAASVLVKGVLYEGTVVEIGTCRWVSADARNVTVKRSGDRIAVYANILR